MAIPVEAGTTTPSALNQHEVNNPAKIERINALSKHKANMIMNSGAISNLYNCSIYVPAFVELNQPHNVVIDGKKDDIDIWLELPPDIGQTITLIAESLDHEVVKKTASIVNRLRLTELPSESAPSRRVNFTRLKNHLESITLEQGGSLILGGLLMEAELEAAMIWRSMNVIRDIIATGSQLSESDKENFRLDLFRVSPFRQLMRKVWDVLLLEGQEATLGDKFDQTFKLFYDCLTSYSEMITIFNRRFSISDYSIEERKLLPLTTQDKML